MDLKDQISEVIDSGKRDSKLELNWESKPHGLGSYQFRNEKLKKEARGKFLIKEGKVFALINESDYSKDYVRKKIREEFSNLNIKANEIAFANNLSLEMSDPRIGDEILVKGATEDTTQLNAGRRFFAVNSDLPDCNGDTLRENFQAQFITEVQRGCVSGSNNDTYQKFSLIG